MQHLIYIALLEEGTDVWRPVQAEHLGANIFRISGSVPEDELWQFQPGEVVQCVERQLSGGQRLVAIARAATAV